MRLWILVLGPALLFADPDPVHLLVWDSPGSARVQRFGQPAASRIATASWSTVLADRAPGVLALDPHRLLAVWTGSAGSWYAILALHGGALHELGSGPWPDGWAPRGAADFDGDGEVDLVATRTRGEGNGQSFDVQVALARPGGAFAFDGPVTQVLDNKRGAYFAVGDMDRDGQPDLVYHGYEHGGDYQTELRLLKGAGGGRLAAIEQATTILTSPQAATSPLLGDFDGDGDLDVFLPPDDDVDDLGQAYLALNSGNGQMGAVTPSLDFDTDREDGTGDELMADGRVADLDGDGRADVLVSTFDISARTFRTLFHRGLGGGRFEETPVVVLEGSYVTGPPRAIGWLRPLTKAPQPVPAGELDWAALASERASEAGPAVRALGAAGRAATPWIEGQLTLARPFDPAAIAALVAELDSPRYATREEATRRLVALGDVAIAPLKDALAAAGSLEVRTRLTRILEVLAQRPANQAASSDDRRLVRVLAVLEMVSDDAARALVGRLAEQGPTPFVRQAAQRARERMG